MCSFFKTYVNTRFGQMHFNVARSPSASHRALLCLHMSPLSGRCFNAILPDLSVDRDVFAPDYPGFGGSDPPPATPHVTIQDYASNIWQGLDALNVDRIDIVGHHTGSKVAAEMAYQQPARVGGIIMIAASLLDTEDLADDKRTFDPLELAADGSHMITLWKIFQSICPTNISPEHLTDYVCTALRPGDKSQWANRASYVYNADFRTALKGLSQKVIVINPKDDLYDRTPNIMAHLKNAMLLEKTDWQHGFFDHQTRDVACTLKQCLIDLDALATGS